MIRLFGSKVYVSVFAFVILVAVSLSVDAVFFYIAIFGAVLHEAAHLIAMRLCGAPLIRISIYPCGADIVADMSRLSPKSEAIIAAAGPIASISVSVLSFLMWKNTDIIYLLAGAVSNLVLFCVNAFPVKGLDGGRVLFSLLLMKYDVIRALGISDVVSTVAFCVLCVLSIVLLHISGYNLSLVFVCTYLFISEYARQKMCGTGIS